MKMLNLGCGNRYLADWTNLDFVSSGPGVLAHNLLKGIPLADDSFDVVYHSHVLEHFSKDTAPFFIQECHRVMKRGAVLRIAVPDLEQIARIYLRQLENVLSSPDSLNEANYNWAVIELLDQAVRHKSGGNMATYWKQQELVNEDWIKERMGEEFAGFRNSIKKTKPVKNGKNFLLRLLRYWREKLVVLLANEPRLFEYMALGRFRLGGEIHQWMYDRYSLALLLKDAGFRTIGKTDAFTSMIADWKKYQWLDVESGKIRKPDSIFMEAMK